MATKMDITDFATSDLVAELATRSNVDQDDLDEAFGYQRVISNGEMQKVYDLFHLGKDRIDRCLLRGCQLHACERIRQLLLNACEQRQHTIHDGSLAGHIV